MDQAALYRIRIVRQCQRGGSCSHQLGVHEAMEVPVLAPASRWRLIVRMVVPGAAGASILDVARRQAHPVGKPAGIRFQHVAHGVALGAGAFFEHGEKIARGAPHGGNSPARQGPQVGERRDDRPIWRGGGMLAPGQHDLIRCASLSVETLRLDAGVTWNARLALRLSAVAIEEPLPAIAIEEPFAGVCRFRSSRARRTKSVRRRPLARAPRRQAARNGHHCDCAFSERASGSSFFSSAGHARSRLFPNKVALESLSAIAIEKAVFFSRANAVARDPRFGGFRSLRGRRTRVCGGGGRRERRDRQAARNGHHCDRASSGLSPAHRFSPLLGCTCVRH